MKTLQKGFTLIELMIVVAIIAILAAIAIPAYQDYVIRSQASEGLSLADGSKTAIAEFYSNYGHWPLNNASAGLATSTLIKGKYVSEVNVGTTTGQIIVTFSGPKVNSKIAGDKLVLSGVKNAGSTSFVCKTGAPALADKYLPSNCHL